MNLFENILFINLKHRKDRLKNSIKQLNLLKKQIPNINWERFEAIKHDNGAIGCAMSHLECLYIAKEKNWEHVFICEDDIDCQLEFGIDYIFFYHKWSYLKIIFFILNCSSIMPYIVTYRTINCNK